MLVDLFPWWKEAGCDLPAWSVRQDGIYGVSRVAHLLIVAAATVHRIDQEHLAMSALSPARHVHGTHRALRHEEHKQVPVGKALRPLLRAATTGLRDTA